MATQYMYGPSQSYGAAAYSNHESPGRNGKNGNFAFKKRFEHIDWRKIASIDIDQISRTLDFNALQENIMNLTFCNVESELDMRMVDPNFIKLFKLAQFTIEYLLHSQDYLAGVVASSEEKVKLSEEEMSTLKNEIEKLKEEIVEIKKESHKRKKLLIAQQQMIHSGSESYNKCPFCSKAFLNVSFLQSHIFRRHQEYSSKGSSTEPPASSGGSMNKTLERELNNIKERLHVTETALKEEKQANRSLKNSLKDRSNRSIVNINSDIYQDKLRDEEQQREIDDMREMFEKELRDVNLKLRSSERALVEVTHGQRSNLGALEDDDDDVDRVLIKRQREDVAMLKEQLQDQLNNVERQMSQKVDKQDRKWSKKVQNMTKQHAEELNKLNNALEKTSVALMENQASRKPEIEQQHRENENLLRKSREQEMMLNTLEEEMIQTEELRKSAEIKRKQHEREKRITTKNETVVETFINKKTKSPGLKSSSPARFNKQQPQPSTTSMYPSDDEDESTATGLLTGTGTGSFRTSAKGTLHSSMGSTLDPAMGTKEFVDEIRRNPTLNLMRTEFNTLLDEKLEKIGVNPKLPGISDTVRDNKLTMLKTQRQSLEKKYADFVRLRHHLDMLATTKAKEKYKEMKRSPPAASKTLNGSRNLSPAHPVQRRTFPQPSSSSSGPSPRPRGSGLQQPVPVPRSTSPNKNLQSTGSTGTEWTSTQWDSDDSFESDDDSLLRDVRPLSDSPNKHTVPSAAPRLIHSRPLTNTELDDDWESDSEPEIPKPTVIVSKPKGANVSKLSRSIEMQLNNRGGIKKPAGAVDTMKSNDPFDDSDFDSDDDGAIKPTPQKRVASRGSHNDSDFSNTYGTSQWGSSSKGISSVHDNKRPQSKSSFVSVTDVSSDEDLDINDI